MDPKWVRQPDAEPSVEQGEQEPRSRPGHLAHRGREGRTRDRHHRGEGQHAFAGHLLEHCGGDVPGERTSRVVTLEGERAGESARGVTVLGEVTAGPTT